MLLTNAFISFNMALCIGIEQFPLYRTSLVSLPTRPPACNAHPHLVLATNQVGNHSSRATSPHPLSLIPATMESLWRQQTSLKVRATLSAVQASSGPFLSCRCPAEAEEHVREQPVQLRLLPLHGGPAAGSCCSSLGHPALSNGVGQGVQGAGRGQDHEVLQNLDSAHLTLTPSVPLPQDQGAAVLQ